MTSAAGLLLLVGAAGFTLAADPSSSQGQQSNMQGRQSSQPGQQSSQRSWQNQQSQSPSSAGGQQQSGQSWSASGGGSPRIALGEVVPLEGKITKIDKQNRTVTVQGPRGHSVTVKADQQAQQFDQLKVGDQIRAQFFQGVVIGLAPQNQAAPGMEAVEIQGTSGKSPSELRMATFTMQAKIDSVDPSKHSVTLTGPEGKSETFHVAPDVKLDQIKPGQTINVRYTMGVAMELQRK